MLESPWKVLEFFVQKRVRALVSRFLIVENRMLAILKNLNYRVLSDFFPLRTELPLIIA